MAKVEDVCFCQSCGNEMTIGRMGVELCKVCLSKGKDIISSLSEEELAAAGQFTEDFKLLGMDQQRMVISASLAAYIEQGFEFIPPAFRMLIVNKTVAFFIDYIQACCKAIEDEIGKSDE